MISPLLFLSSRCVIVLATSHCSTRATSGSSTPASARVGQEGERAPASEVTTLPRHRLAAEVGQDAGAVGEAGLLHEAQVVEPAEPGGRLVRKRRSCSGRNKASSRCSTGPGAGREQSHAWPEGVAGLRAIGKPPRPARPAPEARYNPRPEHPFRPETVCAGPEDQRALVLDWNGLSPWPKEETMNALGRTFVLVGAVALVACCRSSPRRPCPRRRPTPGPRTRRRSTRPSRIGRPPRRRRRGEVHLLLRRGRRRHDGGRPRHQRHAGHPRGHRPHDADPPSRSRSSRPMWSWRARATSPTRPGPTP